MCCVCSAMNTKSVVPSFGLLNGLVSGGGDGMALPSDPVAAAKALGLVGEIFSALSSQPSLFFFDGQSWRDSAGCLRKLALRPGDKLARGNPGSDTRRFCDLLKETNFILCAGEVLLIDLNPTESSSPDSNPVPPAAALNLMLSHPARTPHLLLVSVHHEYNSSIEH